MRSITEEQVKVQQERLNCDQQATNRVDIICIAWAQTRDSIHTSWQGSEEVIMRVHQMVEESKNYSNALENDSGKRCFCIFYIYLFLTSSLYFNSVIEHMRTILSLFWTVTLCESYY